MDYEKDVNIDSLSLCHTYTDRSIYRKNISVRGKYSYRVRYRYTDLYITSDRDLSGKLREPVISFYDELEKVISADKRFKESLSPLDIDKDYPPIIKEMCRSSGIFGVGPMATVAGALCDRIAGQFAGECKFLMIENGGDSYIKSNFTVRAALFTGSTYFPDNLNVSIGAGSTPCGLCSSSGRMGHSLSLGESDMVTVMSDTAVMADAAATAIANSIRSTKDVDRAIELYRHHKQVKGLVIIKDNRLAVWGDLRLNK